MKKWKGCLWFSWGPYSQRSCSEILYKLHVQNAGLLRGPNVGTCPAIKDSAQHESFVWQQHHPPYAWMQRRFLKRCIENYPPTPPSPSPPPISLVKCDGFSSDFKDKSPLNVVSCFIPLPQLEQRKSDIWGEKRMRIRKKKNNCDCHGGHTAPVCTWYVCVLQNGWHLYASERMEAEVV